MSRYARVGAWLMVIALCLSLFPVGVLADSEPEDAVFADTTVFGDETASAEEDIEIIVAEDEDAALLADEEEKADEADSDNDSESAEAITNTDETGDEVSFEDSVADEAAELVSDDQCLVDDSSDVGALASSEENPIVTYEEEPLVGDDEFGLWMDGAGVTYAKYPGVDFSNVGLPSDRVQALTKAMQMVTIQWTAIETFPAWKSSGGVYNSVKATDGTSSTSFVKGKTYTGIPYSMGKDNSYDNTKWAAYVEAGSITNANMSFTGTCLDEKYRSNTTARGVDCSYFVYIAIKAAVGSSSIAHQSTEKMLSSSYYSKLSSYKDMLPGDLFLKNGHVMMFVGMSGNKYAVFEADAEDSKCSYNIYTESYLTENSYKAYRFKNWPNNPTPPSTPVISSVTANSTTSLTVKWGAVDGATSYIIKRRTEGSDETYYEIEKNYTKTSYTDTKLKAGTKYWYHIYAVNSAGTSSYSKAVTGVTECDPTTITSITTVSSSALKLEWEAVKGASTYRITRRLDTDSTDSYKTVATGVKGTSYTDDKDLEAGTKYVYHVFAVTENGDESEKSNGKAGTTKTVLTMKYNTNGGTLTSDKYTATSSGIIQKDSKTLTVKWDYGEGDEDSGLWNASTFGLSRTGYKFKGWSTSKDGSSTVFDQNDTTLKAEQIYTNLKNENKTVTLYAIWTPNTYSVTYNANGGSGAPSAQTKTYGVSLTLSNTKPTRTGYTFQNWNTKSDGSGTSYAAGASYTGNAALTLYAIWKVNTYTVTYNANGGGGAPSAQKKTYGVSLTLSSTKPTWTGYTFLGWATSASATTAEYQPGWSYTNNANVTLYAIWKANTYTITYDANGGSGAPPAQIITYGTNVTLSGTKPTRDGYTFKGWATSASATTAQYVAGGSYMLASDVTLYAVWEKDAESPPTTGATLAVSSASVKPGGEVTVTVTAQNMPSLAGLSFKISYDKTKLQLLSAEDAGLTGWTVGIGGGEAAVWDSDKDDVVNGTILTLTFKALGEAGSTAQVTLTELSAIKADETEVGFTATSGTIKINDRVPGDVTGDGKVNLTDLVRMRKYLAGMDVVFDVDAGDVTGDGKVGLADLVRLRKYLAGMDVILL